MTVFRSATLRTFFFAFPAGAKELNTILKDVNRIILFIRANALHHRRFREILCPSETSAEDILYHSAVRWLSIGETSRRVLQLRKEIVEYYSTKNKECLLLDKDFLMSLGFLVDFFTQVNFLNQSTGKGNNCLSRVQNSTRFP